MRQKVLLFFLCILVLVPSFGMGEELPLCADLAGDYIARDRGEPGVRELASYLYATTILTAAPYTEYSRTRLTLYSTTITSPIIARGAHIYYYQTLTQQAPYQFVDAQNNPVVFTVDDAGRPTGFLLGETAYVPMIISRTPLFVNGTLFVLQGMCVFGPAMLLCVLIFWLLNRRRNWRSFMATRMNTALCAVVAIASLNTFYLLAFAVPEQTYAQYQPLLWLNLALMVLMVALPFGMAATWRKSELILRQKLSYAGTMVIALLLFCLMLVWQLYR